MSEISETAFTIGKVSEAGVILEKLFRISIVLRLVEGILYKSLERAKGD